MRVWTWQGFDIVSEPYRRECAWFYNHPHVPGIKKAYEKLWDRMGTDQLIWCSVQPCEWKQDSRRCWELNVPKDLPGRGLIRIVNANWWHRIIGQPNTPAQLQHHWECVARQRLSTRELQDTWVQAQEKEYLSPRSDYEIWEMFLNCRSTDEGAEALVRLPVCSDWVASTHA